ncbi:MAG TPA: magnesium chelatase, partial [Candidatus Dormibacteraeota bacterium]|nr:magnesium chelatase [Candidatus Dormibacteraeota bacterium]
CVDVTGIRDVGQRVEIVERRERFEADPEAFQRDWAAAEEAEAARIRAAIAALPGVAVDREVLAAIARLGVQLEVDGHRADLVARKAAQAYGALAGVPAVRIQEVAVVAPMVLAHRVHAAPGQRPLDIEAALRSLMAPDEPRLQAASS